MYAIDVGTALSQLTRQHEERVTIEKGAVRACGQSRLAITTLGESRNVRRADCLRGLLAIRCGNAVASSRGHFQTTNASNSCGNFMISKVLLDQRWNSDFLKQLMGSIVESWKSGWIGWVALWYDNHHALSGPCE